MKKDYFAPDFVEYGSLASLTGILNAGGPGDVQITTTGNATGTGTGSVDICAEDGGKCKCTDNGTC